jgi:hypothetical protein
LVWIVDEPTHDDKSSRLAFVAGSAGGRDVTYGIVIMGGVALGAELGKVDVIVIGRFWPRAGYC